MAGPATSESDSGEGAAASAAEPSGTPTPAAIEVRNQTFLQRQSAAFVRTTPAGRFLDFNPAFASMLGYTREELLTRPAQAIYVDRTERTRILSSLQPGDVQAFEVELRARDGRLVCAMGITGISEDPVEGTTLETTLIDITARKTAELHAANERQRFGERQAALLDALPAYVALLSREGEVLTVNEAWRQFGRETGLAPGCPIGADYLALCDRAAGSPAAAEFSREARRVLQGTLPSFSLEYPCHAEQARRWFRVTVSALSPSDPTFGAVVMHVDVSDRHEAVEAVVASERRFRALVQNSSDGLVTVNASGTLLYVSPTASRLLGYTSAELEGRPFVDFVHPDDVALSLEPFQEALAHPGTLVQSRVRAWHRDGAWRMLECASVNQLDDPAVQGIVCNFRDVTAAHEAQQRIAERERLFHAVFARAADALVLADSEGRFVAVNPAAEQLFGLSAAELAGRLGDEFTGPEGEMPPAWRPGRVLSGQSSVRRPDGTTRRIEFAATADVLPGLHLSVLRDVTERVQAERLLQETEERLRVLFDGDLVGILIAIEDGTILDANDAFLRIVGQTQDALRAGRLNTRVLTPEAFREADARAHDELWQRGSCTPYEKQYIREDGSRVWVLVGSTAIGGPERQAVAFTLDISKRKAAELAVQRSEQRFSALFHASPVAKVLVDMVTGLIVDANTAFQQLAGTGIGRLRGQRLPALDAWEGAAEIETLITGAFEGARVRNAEARLRSAQGDIRNVLLSLDTVALGDEQLMIMAVTDITVRRALEEQMRQAQKMEAIGRLAGGIAHDFNNLLTAILGFTDLALNSLPGDHPTRPEIEEIYRAGQSAASLTRQLLAFSRRQMLQPEVLDMNAVVASMQPLLRRLLGENVHLVAQLEPALAPILVDKGQLEQVIMNLAVNARDAMPLGGELVIATANAPLGARDPVAFAPVGVTLSVTDSGAGIEPAHLPHLFEPFFTTKPRGKGTGLGLATVHGIVEQSGGSIEVQTEPGRGTTFTIRFPATDAPGPEPRPKEPVSVGGQECILLVEDTPELRRLATAVLERHGYRVLAASDGDEALTALDAIGGRVDLVLTDIIMPRIGGRQLAEVLAARHPHVPVVFMSGYTDDAIVQQGIATSELTFIQKPFAAVQLLHTIRTVLDGTRQQARVKPLDR